MASNLKSVVPQSTSEERDRMGDAHSKDLVSGRTTPTLATSANDSTNSIKSTLDCLVSTSENDFPVAGSSSRETSDEESSTPTANETALFAKPSNDPPLSLEANVTDPILSECIDSTLVTQTALSEEIESSGVIQQVISDETHSFEVIQPALSDKSEEVPPTLTDKSESSEGNQTALDDKSESSEGIEAAVIDKSESFEGIQAAVTDKSESSEGIEAGTRRHSA